MNRRKAASLSTEIGSGKALVINLTKANEHDDATVKQLSHFRKESGMSLERLAFKIGTSESSLSLYLKKQYTGNVQNINELVKRFLRIEFSKLYSVPTSLDFVMTDTAKKIIKVAEASHIDSVISLILGAPGSGKSTAVKQYYLDNSPNAIYLQLNQSYRTPYEWLKKLSGGYSSGTINSMANYLIKKLSGSNSVLILDQVDYLSLTSIDILRSISEESNTGLVLVGLPTFAKKLKGDSPELVQLRDRIRIYLKLDKLSDEEIYQILSENWAGLTEKQKEIFARYSKGSLRLLSSLVYNCRKYLNQKVNKGFELEDEDIINAASHLPLQLD